MIKKRATSSYLILLLGSSLLLLPSIPLQLLLQCHEGRDDRGQPLRHHGR